MNEDEQMPHPENAKQAVDEGEQGPGAKKWTLGEIHALHEIRQKRVSSGKMCGPDYLRTKLGDAPLARTRANNLIFKFLAGNAPREIFDEYGGGWGRKTTVATEGFKSQAREAIERDRINRANSARGLAKQLKVTKTAIHRAIKACKFKVREITKAPCRTQRT